MAYLCFYIHDALDPTNGMFVKNGFIENKWQEAISCIPTPTMLNILINYYIYVMLWQICN